MLPPLQRLPQRQFLGLTRCTTFNFDLHRHPECYGLIVDKKGQTLAADGKPWQA